MKDILNSYSVTELKKEVSKTNIKGYTKLKKPELIDLMMKSKDRFMHLKMKEKKQPKSEPKLAPKINNVFNLELNPQKFTTFQKIKKSLKPLNLKNLKKKEVDKLQLVKENMPNLFDTKGNFIINEKNKKYINKKRIEVREFIGRGGGSLSAGIKGITRGLNLQYLDNQGNYKLIVILKYNNDVIYIYDGERIIKKNIVRSSFIDNEKQIEEFEKLKKEILNDGEGKKWKDKYLKYVEQMIKYVKTRPEKKEQVRKLKKKSKIDTRIFM